MGVPSRSTTALAGIGEPPPPAPLLIGRLIGRLIVRAVVPLIITSARWFFVYVSMVDRKTIRLLAMLQSLLIGSLVRLVSARRSSLFLRAC